VLALTAALASTSLASPVGTPVILPVEVIGEPGTSSTIQLQLQPAGGEPIRFLWLEIHGLEFDGMAGIRMNACPWVNLTNDTVAVAEPGRRYGGIGGGFATLKMTLPVADDCLHSGANQLAFRFNRSDGVVSGFRVLAFNFLTGDGRRVLPAESFAQEDPDSWTPPSLDPGDRLAGERLWRGAALLSSSIAQAHPIRAHCADCHTQDGRDLKYFNYSNRSIIARARFHGLSEKDGVAIASYIRSLPFPHPGRPWNPPYQPGPGIEDRPVSTWAAGAGLEWILDKDADGLPFLFPSGTISREVFSPDGNLIARQIPIAMQLPDWNHWLPRVAPIDAWGNRYDESELARGYASLRATAYDSAVFEKWIHAREKLIPHLAENSRRWTLQLGEQIYSTQLWQMVKAWELVQQLDLEDVAERPRCWPSNIAALTAPSATHIPNGPSGMNGSGLTNEYFSNAWYELQLLLNSGSHLQHSNKPVDWIYVLDHEHRLETLSGMPEPARVLTTLIKAMQSTDPLATPQDFADGWRPDRNVDPRIMVDASWAATFQPLRPALRRSITQAMLEAWLRKTGSYPQVSYFSRGQLPGTYTIPEELRPIYGGRAWEAAAQFRAAGVDGTLVDALERWGACFTNLARLYQY
jgi:hypothetical protein